MPTTTELIKELRGITGAGGLFGDGVLSLLLGADEEHRLAVGGLLANESHGLIEASDRLL